VSASRILRADPALAKLLAGARYTVGKPSPWTSGDGTVHFGAVVDIFFQSPFSGSGVLPVAQFTSPDATSYKRTRTMEYIRFASCLITYVDLRYGAVVWVVPWPMEGPPGGAPRPSCSR
jgi:hypothetical protein